jgi:glycosyltransferase involved in cell wall biosynthesis
MIIAIDGYEANVKRRVGIGRYAYEILQHIYTQTEDKYQERNSNKNEKTSFRIYLPTSPLPDMPRENSWWRYYVGGPRHLWTIIGLPGRLLRDNPKADIIFSPTHYAPRFVSIPRVITIMDTSYLIYPEMFNFKDLHQLNVWTKYSVNRSDAIITISNNSKHAIIKAYNISENKVVVTYLGYEKPDYEGKLMNRTEIMSKYGIGKHFILSVGTLQPRKNYVKLIEAFSLFLAQNRQRFGQIDLVIIGKRGWLYEPIFAAPRKYGVEERVHFLDFVPDSELPIFYQNALCFALPSLYEGFGLPVVEAMSNRCPVVVSSVSSLPEIAGRAGIYVNPENTADIVKGLLTAVRQRNLQQGRLRIEQGLREIQKFSWDIAAKQTLDVLENIVKNHRKI